MDSKEHKTVYAMKEKIPYCINIRQLTRDLGLVENKIIIYKKNGLD